MHKYNHVTSLNETFRNSVLTLVIGLAIVLSASFGRPLWIDEFLHFALGSHASTGEAWQSITDSILGINHGQTGIYMLVDYWLLQTFGASPVALRLPSILSGIWLFVAAVSFMRFRGFSWRWQLLLVIALFGQNMLMYFVGEARPYMPLAAASVGVLAYYFAPLDRRSDLPVVMLGILSVLLGVLMHPYFSFYWLSLFLFAYAVQAYEGHLKVGFLSMIKHANLILCVVGVLIYFVVASFTWGRSIAEFDMNPFEWIDKTNPLSHFISWTHMQFLNVASWLVLLLMLATIPCELLLPLKWRSFMRPLLAPATLLVLALILSVALSYISYARSYWIVDRQWVASVALCPIAVVWFFAVLAGQLECYKRRLSQILFVGLFVLISLVAFPKFLKHSNALISYLTAPVSTLPTLTVQTDLETELDNAGWVSLANENVRAGGDVWPVFKHFYNPVILE